MSTRLIKFGALSLAAGVFVAMAAPVASAAPAAGIDNRAGSASTAAPYAVSPGARTVGVDSTHVYPSATSTVVGSVGFIDADEVGYFWSAARGDSVTETFNGPNKIKKAKLALNIVQNALNSGATVNWTVSINGTDVGSFQVVEGQLGAVNKSFSFPKITGGTYTVKMRVTNEVAGGQGSHTWSYAGGGQHSVKLKK